MVLTWDSQCSQNIPASKFSLYVTFKSGIDAACKSYSLEGRHFVNDLYTAMIFLITHTQCVCARCPGMAIEGNSILSALVMSFSAYCMWDFFLKFLEEVPAHSFMLIRVEVSEVLELPLVGCSLPGPGRPGPRVLPVVGDGN